MYPDTFLYPDTNVDPLHLHLNGYKRVSGDFYVSICIHLYVSKINIHEYRLWMGDMYPLVSSLRLHLAIQMDVSKVEQYSTRGYKWIQIHFVSDTNGYK